MYDKNVGELRLNDDIVFHSVRSNQLFDQFFWVGTFVSPLVKRNFRKEIEAIEEKATITLIPEETRTTNPSYLKYAAIFVLGLGLAGSVGYPMYQNQIASETLLVETAVQNKFKIKFSRPLSLSSSSCSDTFCKIDYRSKNAITLWLEFTEKKKMLIKPCEF
jgi:hypothetical protein